MQKVTLWFCLSLLCTLVVGCGQKPHEAVDDFLIASGSGQKAAACAAFSTPSRRMLQDMAASGFTGGSDACDHLFTVFSPRGVESLTTRFEEGREEGNKAEVSIVDLEGKKSAIWMVRENGRWKIDLLNPQSSLGG